MEKRYMQVKFKKNGHSEWEDWAGPRSLAEFNRDFEDWICEYFSDDAGEEVRYCKDWDEALEVLNTVGASARAGQFELREVNF